MMPELEPLETDMLSLLRAEKAFEDYMPAKKAAILASVDARIGLPPSPGDGGGGGGGAGGSAASRAAGGAGIAGAKIVAALFAMFAIGVVTGVVVAPSVNQPSNSQASQASAPGGMKAAPSASTNPPSELAAVSVGSLPAASATGASRGVSATTTTPTAESSEAPPRSARGLGAERGLLDVARAALARGEAAEALTAVDRHGREYPDGMLVEEREALAIKALVVLRRRDEARTRAKRFEHRFPHSLMLHAVKGGVGDF